MSKLLPRRHALKMGLGLMGLGLVPALPVLARTEQPLALTPTCGPQAQLTLEETEGPYFTPNTPLKQDFTVDDPRGTPFTLTGLVLNQACQPQAKALIELWHADSRGDYDNQGYKLRGHIFTDDKGRFQFRTVMPGLYPGRTRHFHLKVQRPNGPVLTTQLYFPADQRANQRDGIYDASLLMRVGKQANGWVGLYEFIVA